MIYSNRSLICLSVSFVTAEEKVDECLGLGRSHELRTAVDLCAPELRGFQILSWAVDADN